MDTNDEAPSLTATVSSVIAASGYDEARATLFIRFRSGETYAYANVPPPVHAAFMTAPSKGRFFQAEVAPIYAYRRLDQPSGDLAWKTPSR